MAVRLPQSEDVRADPIRASELRPASSPRIVGAQARGVLNVSEILIRAAGAPESFDAGNVPDFSQRIRANVPVPLPSDVRWAPLGAASEASGLVAELADRCVVEAEEVGDLVNHRRAHLVPDALG